VGSIPTSGTRKTAELPNFLKAGTVTQSLAPSLSKNVLGSLRPHST